jgi:hypothetical protein
MRSLPRRRPLLANEQPRGSGHDRRLGDAGRRRPQCCSRSVEMIETATPVIIVFLTSCVAATTIHFGIANRNAECPSPGGLVCFSVVSVLSG